MREAGTFYGPFCYARNSDSSDVRPPSFIHFKAKIRTWLRGSRQQATASSDSSSRSGLSELPQELLNLIVDDLSDSRADLASICLASRALYGRARQHLCRSLTITTPLKSFALFTEDLKRTHLHTRQHIKHLTLSRFGMKDAEDGTPIEAVTADFVSSLLERLPSLQTLTFNLVVIEPAACRDIWERPRPQRQLEELSFIQADTTWQSWSCKAYLEIMSLFSDVNTLTFKDQFTSLWPVLEPLGTELPSAAYFPRALTVRTLRMGDVRDSLWLPLLGHTRTLSAPTLTALDIAPVHHSAGTPSAELRATLVTTGSQLATLRYRLWPDFFAGRNPALFPSGPYAHVAQLPAVAQWCPRLETFVVRVPLWCSLPYMRSLFQCVVALLHGLPPTACTFALELDFEGHPQPAVECAQDCMPKTLWEMLKFAVEGTRVTRVNLVWLRLKQAFGGDARLEQKLSETDTVIVAALQSRKYVVQSTLEEY